MTVTVRLQTLLPDKTSVVLHQNRYIFKTVNNISECVDIVIIHNGFPCTIYVKTVHWDCILYVQDCYKSTRVHARDLYRIRPLLDLNTSVLLANALVCSRLDYCNSLFLSLTDFELRRLQLVQNPLCRVVTWSSKYCHITPQLKKLH